jgi:endonuclease/exonuclease/phosphatase family metal-dependent hydrolase
MRRFLAAVLVVAFACTGHAAEPLRAAFWNVEWFPGTRPNPGESEERRQIRAVHEDIVKLNADIIGFSEVRDWESAELLVQPLEGFKVDVCSTFPAREGQINAQQVGIASRLQPMSAWVEEFKRGNMVRPPRGFAFAAYEIAPRRLLLAYSMHLKSNRGDITENIAIREESARQLLAHMDDMEKAYGGLGEITWLFMGDFNTDPGDKRWEKERTTRMLMERGFKWAFEGVPFEQRITWPPDQRFPAAHFDHIFYRGAKLRTAEVIETSPKSSDHRPVRAEFDL